MPTSSAHQAGLAPACFFVVAVVGAACTHEPVGAPPMCEMKSEVVADAVSAGLKLEVWASRQLCVVPAESQDLWAYAAQLRVTNTSPDPVQLKYSGGSMAKFAFQPTVMDASRQHTEFLPNPPVDPSTATVENVTLASGATHVIVGNPTYMMIPIQVAASAGAPRRDFAVDFTASFQVVRTKTDGHQIEQVNTVLPTALAIFVKR
jgi:hypothetical protein